MKITVIGHWHGYPESGEATSGYLLEHNGYKLLLDCGSGVLSTIQAYCSLDDLDGIVLSHYHADHKADIAPFQYARIMNSKKSNKKAVTIYGHDENKEDFSKLSFLDVVNAVAYYENEPLMIGPFSFTFCKTKHPVPCFAMRIELDGKTIVYTGDTSYLSQLAEFARGCDLLLSECSGYAKDDVEPFGHMNSTEAGNLAAEAAAKSLVLTHLPHHGNHEQLREEASKFFIGEIRIAKRGLEIYL